MNILAEATQKIISAWLNWYLETQNLPSLAHACFRRYYCSIFQQITRFSQKFKGSHRRKIIIKIFVNFKSACDRIWRVKLTDKLQATGSKVKCSTLLCNKIWKKGSQIWTNPTNGLFHKVVTGTILFNVMIMTCKHNLTKLRMLKEHSLQIKQLLGHHYQTPQNPNSHN